MLIYNVEYKAKERRAILRSKKWSYTNFTQELGNLVFRYLGIQAKSPI